MSLKLFSLYKYTAQKNPGLYGIYNNYQISLQTKQLKLIYSQIQLILFCFYTITNFYTQNCKSIFYTKIFSRCFGITPIFKIYKQNIMNNKDKRLKCEYNQYYYYIKIK